jgi:predicted RNA-binding protein YlxR (DUF448 family)
MIRFVASPDGIIFPDIGHKLDGRGAWLLASRQVLEQAVKSQATGKSIES